MSHKDLCSNTITIKDYCVIAGVSRPAISYRVGRKKILPGILSYSYNSATRMYELVRDLTVTEDIIKQLFRTY